MSSFAVAVRDGLLDEGIRELAGSGGRAPRALPPASRASRCVPAVSSRAGHALPAHASDPPELDFRLSSSLNTGTPGRLLAAHHAGQRQGGHGCVLRCQRPGLRCLPVDGFCHLSPGRSTHTAPPGQPDGRGCCPPYVRAQPEAVGSDGHRGGSSGQIQQPARPGIPSSRAVSAGSGGCWVRTSVGQVNGFTDRHLSALPAPGDQPLLAPTRLLALTSAQDSPIVRHLVLPR